MRKETRLNKESKSASDFRIPSLTMDSGTVTILIERIKLLEDENKYLQIIIDDLFDGINNTEDLI